jgi:putative addiction module component (TIGR02574 family)
MMSLMPLTLDQIVEETGNLPQDVVIELVDRIMLKMHGGIAPHVEQAWRQETRRRIAEIQSGKVQGIPGEQVSAEIRKIVGL